MRHVRVSSDISAKDFVLVTQPLLFNFNVGDQPWVEIRDGNPLANAIYRRHYSAKKIKEGEEQPKIFMGPGEHLVLLLFDGSALAGFKKFISDDLVHGDGIYLNVFRNEGKTLSSFLIRQAVTLAWKKWPGERIYTYVDSKKVMSPNPGYCFKKAGWRKCGETKQKKLVVLEMKPEFLQEQKNDYSTK